MARIPLVTREQIAEKEKPAFDAFMASRANRPNVGPYSLLLHMPEMAQRLEALRIHLREEASLPQKLQELVMISVAREMSCAFIWYAHAAAARQAGVRDDIVDSIRERRPLTNLDPEEQVVVDFTRELLQNRKVSRPTFEAATDTVRAARNHDPDESDRLLCGAGVQHEHLRAGGPDASDGKGIVEREARQAICRKTGKVSSSVARSKAISTGRPTLMASGATSRSWAIMRTPSTRSTVASTYGSSVLNPEWNG